MLQVMIATILQQSFCMSHCVTDLLLSWNSDKSKPKEKNTTSSPLLLPQSLHPCVCRTGYNRNKSASYLPLVARLSS